MFSYFHGDNMNKYELVAILSKYISCKKRIDNNLDEIQRLRSCMEKVTVTYKDAPGWDRKTSDQAVILTEIGKLSDHIKEDSARLQKENARVQLLIDRVEDQNERDVLQLIYINGCSRREAEEKLGYSRSQIYRIHNEAVKNILRKIKISLKDET